MKILTTIALVFLITFIQAQTNPATPNAGFENWTHSSSGYDDPNSWNDLNSSTNILGVTTCYKDSTAADVHSGKFSVHLVTMSSFGQLIPGTITTGTINTSSQTISGGLPYTLRPDSIIGWYKYTSVSGDNADFEFYLFGSSNTDTIGEAFYRTPTSSVSSYTRFSLAISYRSTSTPVNALWILTSSTNQNSGHSGSQLYADDLGLVFDTVTGISNIINPEKITIGPNPATNHFLINNNTNSSSVIFTLTDITGRKVVEKGLMTGINYMELVGLAEGVYVYNVSDEHNTVIKTGKIVVQK